MICNKDLITSRLKELNLEAKSKKSLKGFLSDGVSLVLGFISAFFIVGFVIALFNRVFFKEEASFIIFGAVLSGVVYLLKEENHIRDALLITAQGLVIFGFSLTIYNHTAILMTIFVVSLIYIAIFDVKISRVFSSFVASYTLLELFKINSISLIGYGVVLFVSLILIDKYTKDFKSTLEPVITAVVSALVIFAIFEPNIIYYHHLKREFNYHILESLVVAFWIFYLSFYRSGLSLKTSLLIFGALSPFLTLSIWADGFGVAFSYLIGGFAFGLMSLFGVGVLGVIISISIWYYNLSITLTQKSFLMMGSGLVLVLIGVLISKGLRDEDR